MERIEIINSVLSRLEQMNEIVQIKMDHYIDQKMLLKQKQESVQASFDDLCEYIEILKKDLQSDENIFFVGTIHAEIKLKMQEMLRRKEELENKLESVEQQLSQLDEENSFLFELTNEIIDSRKKLAILQKETPSQRKGMHRHE